MAQQHKTPDLPLLSQGKELRDLVEPSSGRSLRLSCLTEDELLQVVQLIGPDPRMSIIPAYERITAVFLKCRDEDEAVIKEELRRIKVEAYRAGGIGHRLQITLDPLDANAVLVRQLWRQWRHWCDQADSATGKSSLDNPGLKSILDTKDRVSQQLMTAIRNHVDIQQKLAQLTGETPGGKSGNGKGSINAEQVLIQINEGADGDKMDGFLSQLRNELKGAISQRPTTRQKPKLITPREPTNHGPDPDDSA